MLTLNEPCLVDQVVHLKPPPRIAIVACEDDWHLLSAGGFHYRRKSGVVTVQLILVDVVLELAHINPQHLELVTLDSVEDTNAISLDCGLRLEKCGTHTQSAPHSAATYLGRER